jgi:2-keto-3-deoxy-L-rhamnonate aldolase RhmA
MRLTIREEEVIVQHILDLDAQGFPPRLNAIKDIADSLLAARHYEPVGQRWPYDFVKRQPKL